MKRGLASLAMIASIAPFFGFFGTVLGILNSFHSSSSQSTGLAMTTRYLSEAMLPALLGFAVALPAFWFYRYLSSRMEAFDLEMANATDGLVRRLLVHPWAVLTSRARSVASATAFVFEPPGRVEATGFRLRRMYPHGLLQLIWPRLDSILDAEIVLSASAGISLAYGVLGWLTYYWMHRPASGLVILAFFVIAGFCVKAGFRWAVLSQWFFLAWASAACVIPYRDYFSAAWLAAAPLLLVGSFRAASVLKKPSRWLGILLTLLGLGACVAVLLGTSIALYATDGSYSLEPTLHRDDRVLCLNAPFLGALHRGELVMMQSWNSPHPIRVVGLPGDRIQVAQGKLIRNGGPVDEPYSQQTHREAFGDFPLPADAFSPNTVIAWQHADAYGDRLHYGKPYVVPEGMVFLLNDDRNELEDSRILGPIPNEEIVGRPFLAFNLYTIRWFLPRLIR